jgi:hypothetical protein
LGSSPLAFTIFLTANPTTAHLTSIDCARLAHASHRILITAATGETQLGVGRYVDIDDSDETASVQVAEIKVLGVPVAQVRARSHALVSDSSQQVEFEGRFPPAVEPDPSHTRRVGEPAEVALANLLSETLAGLEIEVVLLGSLPIGLSTAAVATAAGDALGPVIEALSVALDPILRILGFHVGGGQLTLQSLRPGSPELLR